MALMRASEHLMQTERIRLVPPSMDLVVDAQKAIRESERELSEYLTWVQASLQEPEKNMLTAIENHKEFRNEVRFYILKVGSSQLIGTIGLLIRDLSVPFFEVGYWIRKTETGNGYAMEAVGMLEKYAFRELEARRLEIRTASGNAKSRAVAERSGYMYEATLINERRLPSGELTDTVVYAKYFL